MYHDFAINVNIESYNNFVNNSFGIISLYSFKLIRDGSFSMKRDVNKNIFDFLSNSNNQKKFNKIIFSVLAEHCIKFLLENDILDSFTIALTIMNKKYENVKAIPALLDYVTYFNDNGFPLNTFFSKAFVWSLTDEGFDFWDRNNTNFENFILNILRNE